MATAKKPAAKKPAAKKTAAAKKPAAKAASAKKTTAKKPATKVAATKVAKTKVAAAKKAPAKKATAKKPAVKKAVKKAAPVKKVAAVKKPAAKKAPAKVTTAKKSAVKPATKATATKTVATKVAATKVVATKTAATKVAATKVANVKAAPKPVEVPDANVKLRNLFEAFSLGKLPFANGYIVSSFFSETTAYSIYEIVSYAGVKEIHPTGDGLQFISGGKKLYILVENDTYQNKFIEPVSRVAGESIPKRFSELEILTARNQYKIMISKEPIESYGSFTVLKPSGSINFAVVFYQTPELFETLSAYISRSLNKDRKVPEHDAKKAAQFITEIVRKTMSFEGDFQ